MSATLYINTIRYLNCLFNEGYLSEEKIEKLANFSLTLERENDSKVVYQPSFQYIPDGRPTSALHAVSE